MISVFITLLIHLIPVQNAVAVYHEVLDVACVDLSRLGEKEFIVKNRKEMIKIFNKGTTHCSYNYPTIDFNKKSLLVFTTSSSGCEEPDFNYSYKKSNDTLILTVEEKSYGTCRKAMVKTHWVEVPKIYNESIKFLKLRKP